MKVQGGEEHAGIPLKQVSGREFTKTYELQIPGSWLSIQKAVPLLRGVP